MKRLILVFVVFFLSVAIASAEARKSKVRRAFLKSQGLTHTPKGCQVDHIVSLQHGGADDLSNLCLVCGNKLPVKEWAERRPETLRLWLRDNRTWLKNKGCRYEWTAAEKKTNYRMGEKVPDIIIMGPEGKE